MGQRHVLGAGLVVDQHRVALAEGAPPGVLAGQADVDALEQQRAEGQRLGQRPVDLARPRPARPAGANWRASLGWTVKPSGTVVQRRRPAAEQRPASTPVSTAAARGPAGGRRPAAAAGGGGALGPHLVEGRLQLGVEVVERLLGLLHGDVAPADQRLGVELAHRALGARSAGT